MTLPVAPELACRPGCGACCIAPSISSPIPQIDGSPPRSKQAGERCVQLDAHFACRLFGRPERPSVCSTLRPEAQMCGSSATHAMRWLARLEAQTASP